MEKGLFPYLVLGIRWMNAWKNSSCRIISIRRFPAGDQWVLEVAFEVALEGAPDSHYTTESDQPQSPPPAMLQPLR